jgi:hypothetical protein
MSVYSHWELCSRMNDNMKYWLEITLSGKPLAPTHPSMMAQRHSAMLRSLSPDGKTMEISSIEEEKS